jgi:hypothetical protein
MFNLGFTANRHSLISLALSYLCLTTIVYEGHREAASEPMVKRKRCGKRCTASSSATSQLLVVIRDVHDRLSMLFSSLLPSLRLEL